MCRGTSRDARNATNKRPRPLIAFLQMFRVSFEELSGTWVFAACLGLATIFVASLYLVSAGLPRDHPVTIRRRILAIACVCLAAPAYLWAWSSDGESGESLLRVLGLKTEGLFWAALSPVVLVSLAYLGPLVHFAWLRHNPFTGLFAGERRDIAFRNFVAAPFAEELVFRACLVPLLRPSLGDLWTIILCPLFFGLAHLHHLAEWARNGGEPLTDVLVELVLQVGYTSVFGMFSAFLFVRSGHLLSPILAHSYCNILGLPPLDAVPSHPYPLSLFTVYVVGLLTFVLLLFPLTSPSLFT